MTARAIAAEQLEERAATLAHEARVVTARGGARSFRRRLVALARRAQDVLERVDSCAVCSSLAAEWLLDNRHIVLGATNQVVEDLTAAFYRILPKTGASGDLRVLRIAEEIVSAGEGYVEVGALRIYIDAFQRWEPLRLSELWALPSFLRLAVLERVVEAASHLSVARADAVVDAEPISTGVACLRALGELDWKAVVEGLSLVDGTLRRDPAGVYSRMDFDTRDRYRRRVEEVAAWSGRNEGEVAERVVEVAKGSAESGHHVGVHLLGDGRAAFEGALGCRPPPRVRIRRACARMAGPLYFGSVVSLTLALAAFAVAPLIEAGSSPLLLLPITLLATVPTSAVAVALANWVATRVARPRVLPKLDLSRGVPDELRTCVAIPALLTDEEEVVALMEQLEVAHAGNRDPNVSFALLADPPDASHERAADDDRLLERAREGVRALNDRHGEEARRPFVLFHRPRRWNPAEGRWMAWERKRGKLHEFNRLLLGATDTGLSAVEGDAAAALGARFVLTLDADTVLTRDAAARLIGTLGHPLNRPRFARDGRVTAGYTVLQPRVETLLSEHPSWFARIMAADEGLDLYSHAVSDVYQDLFGEGIYAGKGLYDVRAFERALSDRVPENALLSHDLFEGVHGRAGLVSDVAVLEGFPGHPVAWMRRMHRWIRGDWQLLPWLLPSVPSARGGRIPNRLDAVARWKLADNLRRSLLAPSLVLLAVLGWTALPGPALWWTALAALVPAIPLLTAALDRARRMARGEGRSLRAHRGRRVLEPVARWALGFLLLPWETVIAMDAVVRTLVRVAVTRRHLLEWTTAAVTSRVVHAGRGAVSRSAWLPGTALTVAAGVAVFASGVSAGPPILVPLVLWLASPAVVSFLARRPARERRNRPLAPAARIRLRVIARRTWAFFERFMGPEDHWLPPDHVQLDPTGGPAHRTSPTNIGLGLLSVQLAHDLGHVTMGRMIAQISNALDSMDRLERHRGHFLNWYDTRRLASLSPRYVSTVDSGNLAASLMVVRAALGELADTPEPRREEGPGLADGLDVLAELLLDSGGDGSSYAVRSASRELRTTAARARAIPGPGSVRTLVVDVEAALLRVERVIADALPRLDAEAGVDVRWWAGTLAEQAHLEREEIDELHPWLRSRDDPPTACHSPDGGWPVAKAWTRFREAAPDATPLRGVGSVCTRLGVLLDELDEAVRERAREDRLRASWWSEALEWSRAERERMRRATAAARRALAGIDEVTRRIDALLADMDFEFLYDPQRRLLHVGYDLDAAAADRSYYDLYASEARLASYVAMAKGDVPVSHWLSLARPFGSRRGTPVLLSWGGTMFEYLLPGLFVRSPDNSLADLACRAAVSSQMAFGRSFGIPWGVSESAYAERDAGRRYRYRAFGVPELALHRDSTPRRVVAPYACALALPTRTDAAVRNLRVEERMGLLGAFGFFDAIDYGPSSRPPGPGTVVRTVMAHHQGMVLAALHHVLSGGETVRRFHAGPETSALEYLLHERPPALVRPLRRPHRAALPTLRAPEVVPTTPWPVATDAFPPEATVLSNGRLSVLITPTGAGGMRWNGFDVTRWRPDPTGAAWGSWIYVHDHGNGLLTSASPAPTWLPAEREEVVFSEELADFHRDVGDLRLRMRVAVSSNGDVEIRRVSIVNESERGRRIDLTSFTEAALAPPSEDRRHPAFAKLFVEADFDPSTGTLGLARRSEGLDGKPVCVAHRVIARSGQGQLVGWCADRERFLGRLGDARRPPGALEPSLDLRRHGPWAPLDPILSLTLRVSVPAGDEAVVTFLTAVGPTRQAAAAGLDAHTSDAGVTLAVEQARDRERHLRQRLEVGADRPRVYQRLTTILAHPFRRSAEPADGPAPARSRQDVLWSLGVSGDRPIVTARDSRPGEGEALRDLLEAHRYLREHGVAFDLVVVGLEPDGYGAPVRTWVEGALAQAGQGDLLGTQGGVHYVSSARLSDEQRTALEQASSFVVDGSGASLRDALPPAEPLAAELPAFVPVPSTPPMPRTRVVTPRTSGLTHFNGWGGFTPEGDAYVIRVAGIPTPAPWSNVLANPRFGTLVTESGGGFTWDGNSGEARLTPWTNDPVLDPHGEVVYLRDEETAAIWTPTPSPAGEGEYEVRHAASSTVFAGGAHGLEHRMRVWIPVEGRTKVTELELSNSWPRSRRITVTAYVAWTLGANRWITAPHVVTRFLEAEGAILAENRFSWRSGLRWGFLASDAPVHGFTCDRAEFLGPPGDQGRPQGLVRVGLAGATGARLDPCGALQVHVDLAPGEARTVRFFLGAVDTPEELASVLEALRAPDRLERSHASTDAFWDGLLGATTVSTPEPAVDLLVNRWGLHQTLASRLWGRTGFYQSSGAFGFRDQLQDVLALVGCAPDWVRDRIVDAARHQFSEGDVLHWWHPPSDRGVRTRCSDDRLWLPWVAAHAARTLGREGLMDAAVPFLEAPPLADDEAERYDAYPASGPPVTIFEHCLRALDMPHVLSPRGVPLIGHGDWNDGLNRVGAGGRGESFWLGWFLSASLLDFAQVCQDEGEAARADAYRRRADAVRAANEQYAWDGAWYRRATYDDGAPLGSVVSDEGIIDSLPQSWAVLCGAADEGRARKALDAAWQRLVDRENLVVRLLTPPYHRTRRQPGYIKSYPPGVRENGGQYTHAAVWVGWAYTALGDGDRAMDVFRMLSPVLRTATRQGAERYRVEPYVLAGDVYGEPPHCGRGGWTWYTGSAAWLYRLATEAILGIDRVPGGLHLRPCVPRAWSGYRIVQRHGAAVYEITVENPDRVGRGRVELTLDGRALAGDLLPMEDDGHTHQVRAVIRAPEADPSRLRRRAPGTPAGR